MPSKNPALRFQNIIDEIDYVENATAHMSFEAFTQDQTIRRAVERAFAIISEAAVKLGDEAGRLAPDISWPDIRGLGNVIRHEYGEVDYRTLWELREKDMPNLRRACQFALSRLAGEGQP